MLAAILLFSSSGFALCFAVLGDNRDGDETFKRIISKISADKEIGFVINTGDMTSHGTKDEYKRYFDMAGKCRVEIYDVMGNHDIGSLGSGRGIFEKKYGRSYYSFDKEGVRFILLDNSRKAGMGKKQISWMKERLKYPGTKLVFMHKPLFDPTGSFPRYIMDNKKERNLLFNLLNDADVENVFAGHIHGYGKGEYSGIIEIVTGGGGAPLYLPRFSGGFNHYVKVKVEDGRVTDEVIDINND